MVGGTIARIAREIPRDPAYTNAIVQAVRAGCKEPLQAREGDARTVLVTGAAGPSFPGSTIWVRRPEFSPPEAGRNRHLRPVNSPPLAGGSEPLSEVGVPLTILRYIALQGSIN